MIVVKGVTQDTYEILLPWRTVDLANHAKRSGIIDWRQARADKDQTCLRLNGLVVGHAVIVWSLEACDRRMTSQALVRNGV